MSSDYNKPTELYDPRNQGQGNLMSPQAGGLGQKKTEVLRPKGPRIFAMLVGVDGSPALVGQIFRLDTAEPTTIGRDYLCDIVVDEPSVSRQHAKIRLEELDRGQFQFFIQDLAAENGIQVNGEPAIKHYLEDGDRITVGRNVLVFKWINDSAGTTSNKVETS